MVDRVGEWWVYVNFVSVYDLVNDFELFIYYYFCYFKVIKEMKDKVGEGYVYVNFGIVYYNLGKF